MFVMLLSSIFVIVDAKMVVSDLTHEYDNVTTLYWPGSGRFRLFLRGNEDPFYEGNTFSAPEHGGTHMDAPRHFVKGKRGIAQIRIDDLIRKNPFVVDVSMEASKDSDLLITRQHIENSENKNGNGIIEEGAMVLLYTGWSSKWSNASKYFGGDPTNFSTFHFPGLEPGAATWLVNDKKIGSIGIDTASIDRGQSEDFQSHKNLFKKDVPAFENVNLEKIMALKKHSDLMIVALPMKIKYGSGAPLRIIAMYDDEIKSSGRSSYSALSSIVLYIIGLVFWYLDLLY